MSGLTLLTQTAEIINGNPRITVGIIIALVVPWLKYLTETTVKLLIVYIFISLY